MRRIAGAPELAARQAGVSERVCPKKAKLVDEINACAEFEEGTPDVDMQGTHWKRKPKKARK